MIIYLLALASVSIIFYSHAMQVGYIILGCFWVFSFFYLAVLCSKEWRAVPERVYVEYVFVLALVLRCLWVIVSYYFYESVTGTPFEFEARDSIGYHLDAEWLAGDPFSTARYYLFGGYKAYSDSGFPFYLTIIYKLFGPSIMIARLFNAVLSSWTCTLVYRLSSRTFGESVGRMAGIMMVFMPNLIIYCGYHLKETVMLFLEVACLERFDYSVRSQKTFSWISIVLSLLLAGCLFLFRTVMGAAALFAFASTILVSSISSLKKNGKRFALIGWGALALIVIGGGTLSTEIEGLWEERDTNIENKRLEQTLNGNRWAKYATGTVMAPMVFVLPFATMVDVDQQYGQQAKSGGNFIRNFMGFFAILAVFEAFRRKKWRDYVLIGAFIIAYLGVISTSGYSNSERFLLPGLPCLVMMWAYGVSVLREKTYGLLFWWSIVVFVMEIAWAYFKLGSRGIL